ncbi:MAG: VOC family protein [Candidatus Heimdallarchaeota archaeon]|nr:VOC family protein [Candidatus Heimdallarchaeota archaeon]
MAGIVFVKTKDLEKTVFFYKDLGMKHWLSQPGIEFLSHENMIIGFQQTDEISKDLLLTFFYQTREEVDLLFEKYKNVATSELKENTKYRIYNFFAEDPEGRAIEFQCFLHDLKPICITWITSQELDVD